MKTPNIIIAENNEQVALELIKIVKDCIEKANEKAIIGVSGGSLPKFLVQGINTDFGKEIEWSKVTFIFCDERMVEFENAESTFGLYKKLLEGSPIKEEQFLKVDVELDVISAARDYEEKIKTLMGDQPKADLLLLGMGPDGHTCSLFPGHDLLDEKNKIVSPINNSPKPPPERVTLTLPIINSAKAVAFVSTGEGKKEIIQEVLKEKNNSYPATLVNPTNGILHWIIDKPAGSLL